MECERCGNKHDGSFGSGRFCCRPCANSRREHTHTNIERKCTECGNRVTVNKTFPIKFVKCCECIKNINLNKKKGREKKRNTEQFLKYQKRGLYCLNCKELLVERKQTKYCSTECQLEYQYKQYIERWKNGLEDGMRGKSWTSNHIRRYLLEKYNYKCSKCSWSRINSTTQKSPLELDHIDGNYKNNEEKNLTILCPNCHSLTPTYRALNIGNGREYRYKTLNPCS